MLHVIFTLNITNGIQTYWSWGARSIPTVSSYVFEAAPETMPVAAIHAGTAWPLNAYKWGYTANVTTSGRRVFVVSYKYA